MSFVSYQFLFNFIFILFLPCILLRRFVENLSCRNFSELFCNLRYTSLIKWNSTLCVPSSHSTFFITCFDFLCEPFRGAGIFCSTTSANAMSSIISRLPLDVANFGLCTTAKLNNVFKNIISTLKRIDWALLVSVLGDVDMQVCECG